MPGSPVFPAVFNWRSLTRACSSPFDFDFQACGPSSIITRMSRRFAEMVEPSGQDLRADGSSIATASKPGGRRRNDFAGDRGGTGRVEAGRTENHYAKIGPAAESEIDREHGHISEVRPELAVAGRRIPSAAMACADLRRPTEMEQARCEPGR